ncbi:guanine nucleotide exchange factor [Pelomyxa schiedti]|nr:guanine nucleotide exchange factor [Pelomyxa schiedti]
MTTNLCRRHHFLQKMNLCLLTTNLYLLHHFLQMMNPPPPPPVPASDPSQRTICTPTRIVPLQSSLKSASAILSTSLSVPPPLRVPTASRQITSSKSEVPIVVSPPKPLQGPSSPQPSPEIRPNALTPPDLETGSLTATCYSPVPSSSPVASLSPVASSLSTDEILGSPISSCGLSPTYHSISLGGSPMIRPRTLSSPSTDDTASTSASSTPLEVISASMGSTPGTPNRCSNICTDWIAHLTPEELESLSPMMNKRKKVAEEILSTEVFYVRQLDTIIEKFVEPMKTNGMGCSKDEIFQIFSNIQVIRNCHDRLKDTINHALTSWGDNSGLGAIFQQTTWIKFYKYYVNNYGVCMTTLKSTSDKYPEFKHYLESLNYTPTLGGLNLEGLLIAPVQRIPRYVLLLTDLLKSTPRTHPDHTQLKEALATIKELADYINEHKHYSDNVCDLQVIQAKFIDFTGPPLTLNAKRHLIKDGPILIDKEKDHLWIFSDIAIITRAEQKKGAGLFKYKQCLQLKTATVQAEEACKFRIVSMEGAFRCQAASAPEREIWVKALNDALTLARDTMIKSLFVDEVSESEGSKRFNEVKEAEIETKKLAVINKIYAAEKEYLAELTYTYTTFLVPIKKCVDTTAMVKLAQCEGILSNFEALLTGHNEFMQDLSVKVAAWNAESTLSEMFTKSPAFVRALAEYVTRHPDQLSVLNNAMNSQVFHFWLTDVEIREKKELKVLLELPFKRLADYYLATQEMLQYTPRKSSDFDPLSKLVNELHTLTEEASAQTRAGSKSGRRLMPMPSTKAKGKY